jgi:hypothetical protein
MIPEANLATARLSFLRARLADVLDKHPDGPLARAALLAADFSVENSTDARALEWQRKIDVKMWPGMPRKDRKEAAKAAKANKTIWRLSLMWRAVAALVAPDGPSASGWARLALADPEEGIVRVLRLKGRREVAEGWRKPTLLIDATLQPDLIRPFWPTLEVIAEISVAMPHQHVTQVGDLTYSKRQLERETNMAGVHATVCREARMANGRVLVVAQMEAEEALWTCGFLPNNVATAHHNAIAGRDEWCDVAKLIVIGRTAPLPAAVERQAEAMTGEAIEPLVGWYPKAAVGREMANGTWGAAEADRHPHSIPEAVRWHATEGELIQILGRARGADRTAATPVAVVMMVNTVIPIPIDRVIAADLLAPSVVDKMLAAGAMALTNPADAADCYPGLWGTHEGARTAWKRGTLVHLLIDKYLSGNEPEIAKLALATYQRTGRGQRPTQALFDTLLVPDPRGWLEKRLGALALFRFVDTGSAAGAESPTMSIDPEDGGASKPDVIAFDLDGAEAPPGPVSVASPTYALGVEGPSIVAAGSRDIAARPPEPPSVVKIAGGSEPKPEERVETAAGEKVALAPEATKPPTPRFRICPTFGGSCTCPPYVCRLTILVVASRRADAEKSGTPETRNEMENSAFTTVVPMFVPSPTVSPPRALAVDPRHACPFWNGKECRCRPGFCFRLAARGRGYDVGARGGGAPLHAKPACDIKALKAGG